MTENIEQQQKPASQNVLVNQQLNISNKNSQQQISIGDSSNQIYINRNRQSQMEKQVQDQKKEVENQYNPLKIPADWEFARKHALARQVGHPIHSEDQVYCPCCGYEENRTQLSVCGGSNQLDFLGSGFPLFYNFKIHCILILIAYFASKGAYNLYTNLNGTFCNGVNLDRHGHSCTPTFIFQSSLANKLNDPATLQFQSNFDILALILVTGILFQFRRSSRLIDKDIDESNVTPAHYTVMVKNIPKGLNVDYKKELTDLFTYKAVPQSDIQIVVTKITLIYNMEEIIKLEENINKLVKTKQDQLLKNQMNFQDDEIVKLDNQIEEAGKLIGKEKDEIHLDTQKFAGIALIGFQTQIMKNQVLKNNTHSWQDRFTAYRNQGKQDSLSTNDLSWMNQKLFLEQAPEPIDIEWQFAHVDTDDKLKWRSFSLTISGCFIAFTFLTIYLLSTWVGSLKSWAATHPLQMTNYLTWKIILIAQSISIIIVLFNSFIMGIAFRNIVGTEKISTKTKLGIQFATKLSIALFINTAVLSYIIDIIIVENVIGLGGFIQNGTNVFILNGLLSPLIWFIDPYNLIQVHKRNSELAKLYLNKSVVTQQEANSLMEHTGYFQAKRYADIMKTLWYTFLFGAVMPLGIVVTIIGLSIYYWIDKYNVMRRRTINDSLGIEVSIAMIGLLDLCIVFCGIGNMTMSYYFFAIVHWQDILVFIVGFIIAVSPMQEINDWMFKIAGIINIIFQDHPKLLTYEKAQYQFETDYDRVNPITKTLALEAWTKHKLQFPQE